VNPEVLAALFDVGARVARTALVTTLAAIVALVGTKEHVLRKITHKGFQTSLRLRPHYISHAPP
jgi:hypothetical protein